MTISNFNPGDCFEKFIVEFNRILHVWLNLTQSIDYDCLSYSSCMSGKKMYIIKPRSFSFFSICYVKMNL